MLLLQSLLSFAVAGLLVAAAAVLLYDAWQAIDRSRKLREKPEEEIPVPPFRWQLATRLAAFALLPLFISSGIAVIPAGRAGVRVSQVSGARPGTLYPGVHWITPLIDSVTLYDIRDQVFTAEAADEKKKTEGLKVQTREGLIVGMTIAVRYRLDPRKLDYIHSNLPQPIGEQIVTPVVTSAFREVAPNYIVRELFSTRREEVRGRAAGLITRKLAADGIVVKEVMLRDLILPAEYARGLEGLLLKEQENERLDFEVQIKQKLVRTAELEAEAEKRRQVKRAEADAQTTVLRAKAESDAMQYTLPLKQKQIEQTRLEAAARKESTIQNAEAMAQAKVIDSRAELERGKLMAEAEANRIRVVTAADSERLKVEGAALKDSPLLINKIIAERLSDKVQIVMVPSDGKMFFANDVLKGLPITHGAVSPQ
jgi:regulator of protease activity HflC (stomatin/prohibitin superfamily)